MFSAMSQPSRADRHQDDSRAFALALATQSIVAPIPRCDNGLPLESLRIEIKILSSALCW